MTESPNIFRLQARTSIAVEKKFKHSWLEKQLLFFQGQTDLKWVKALYGDEFTLSRPYSDGNKNAKSMR